MQGFATGASSKGNECSNDEDSLSLQVALTLLSLFWRWSFKESNGSDKLILNSNSLSQDSDSVDLP